MTDAEFQVGQLVSTGYGVFQVAALREDEDGSGDVEVGYLVDGVLAWELADYVRPVSQVA